MFYVQRTYTYTENWETLLTTESEYEACNAYWKVCSNPYFGIGYLRVVDENNVQYSPTKWTPYRLFLVAVESK